MAGIMVLYSIVCTTPPAFLGGLGFGFVRNYFIHTKGYSAMKFDLTSCGTVALLGLGITELFARSDKSDAKERRITIRAIIGIPAIVGCCAFLVGYGGAVGARSLFFYGRKRVDKYIQSTVSKKID